MPLVGVTFFSRNVALGILTKVDSKKTRESVLFSVSVFVSKPSAPFFKIIMVEAK